MADQPSQSSNIGGEDRTVIVHVPTELGPYRLTHMLGRGGMGEVWLANDSNLDREAAIKLMRRELLTNEEAVKRFQREARAVARLNHPNIVQVYSFGEEKGMIYFAMELVGGETIGERLKRLGPMPIEDCVYVLLQAIEGLGYAHARGIVHRDIKPSNIMLTTDWRVKIADFGLAKILEHDSQVTASGTSMGSPCYMSPEQARGQEADHRSDIYALGISFYQMIMNELPFTADTPIAVLLKQLQEALPEPQLLKEMQGGRVMEVLRKMTAKEPDERFQTYGGLAAAIGALAPNVQAKPSAFVATASIPAGPDAPQVLAVPSTESSAVAIDDAAIFEEPEQKKANVPMIVGLVLLVLAVALGSWYAANRAKRAPELAAVSQSPAAAPSPVSGTSEQRAVVSNAVTPTPTLAATATANPTATPETTPASAPAAASPSPGALTIMPDAPAIGTLIVGGVGAAGSTQVQVFSTDGKPAGALPAGTRVEWVNTVGEYRVIRHDGQLLVIPAGQATLVDSLQAATPRPTATIPAGPSPTPPGRYAVLGTGTSASEMIDVFSTEDGARKIGSYPAGTHVRVVSDTKTGYKIMLPDKSGDGYVFKGTAKIEK